MRSQQLQQALLRTLAYSAVFQAPLHLWQVRSYLLSPDFYSREEIRQAWNDLIEKYNFSFSAASQEQLDEKTQRVIRQKKWQQVERAIQWFRYIPWIDSIWVTGSLAIGNVKKTDDVDFLIITQPHRLWLTRAVVVLIGALTQKLRWRTALQDQVQDRWCCNLWLESDSLPLSDRHNLYTARELMQAWPVYQVRAGEAVRLIQENPWIKPYSLLGWQTVSRRAERLLPRPSLFSFLPSFFPLWWKILNRVAYTFQKWYMRPHQTQEKVNFSQAFFHPEDRGVLVEVKYERIVTQILRTMYGQSKS